jgi:hypothetical protein
MLKINEVLALMDFLEKEPKNEFLRLEIEAWLDYMSAFADVWSLEARYAAIIKEVK